MESEPQPTVCITYCAPSPDVLEQFAYNVCQEFGAEYAEPDVIRSLASFLNTVARIHANVLNRQPDSTVGCRAD